MTLQDLCRQYGIRFKKSLGQNLLLDDNINRIMVEAAAIRPDEDVVEVGPGLGALTRRLHPLARRVLAVEIDRAFMPCLEDQFGEVENVALFRGDILNHEVGKLVDEYLPGAEKLKMISNLPYYITTPILFHFWESRRHFSRMVIMVQEEVALRMVAPLTAADYGVLTLAAHLYADVDIVHRVPRTCFRPMPKVDSCIVRLRTLEAPRYADLTPGQVLRVVRTAFSQRRKTIRNSLVRSGGLGIPAEEAEALLEGTGIDLGRRPQTLSLDEFAAIARAMRTTTGENKPT